MINKELFNFDCTGLYHRKQAISIDVINKINELWESDTIKNTANIIKKKATLSKIHADALLHDEVHNICRVSFRGNYHLDHVVTVQQDFDTQNKTDISLHGEIYGKNQSHYYISHLQNHIKTPCITAIGQLSVGIILKGQNKKTGGFCYVPGSHKTAYNITGMELVHALYKQPEDYSDVLNIPELEPGDVIAFPENLIHGNTFMLRGNIRRVLYGMFFPTSITFKKNDEEVATLKNFLNEENKKYIINDDNINQISDKYTYNTRPLLRPLHEWC